MMTHDHEPYLELQQRIDAAKAAGWICELMGDGWWLACNGTYSGMDKSEWLAWADILLDEELWPEIAPLIGMPS